MMNSYFRCINNNDGRGPNEEEFRMWYNIFLEDIPWENCPTAGHAAYSDAVRVVQDFDQPINDPNFPPKTVKASNFMVYHTILKTSKDYYEALRWARKLTDEIGKIKLFQKHSFPRSFGTPLRLKIDLRWLGPLVF